ncbi:hypothetical protein Fmac_031646 [Flemingia macrophylla]|uniref:Isopenicillin N synthase-like Fe(2+) 2OG dioxygenase domain-containing protein n=1 Tax=Flemingia macrophylla TaxID=520843 RepID=A0ABD1L2M7_9FABA
MEAVRVQSIATDSKDVASIPTMHVLEAGGEATGHHHRSRRESGGSRHRFQRARRGESGAADCGGKLRVGNVPNQGKTKADELHLRGVNEEYCKLLCRVVDRLFKSMSIGLGLEKNGLKEAANNGDEMQYLLKINYYPPCPCPNLVLGVPPHTDMSYLTILVPNEVQGLQAFRDGH